MKKIILFLLMCFVANSSLAEGEPKIELRRISLADCVDIGLSNNLDIKIAKVESHIEEQGVMLAESIFDTTISGDVSYTEDKRAKSSIFSGTKTLTNDYGVKGTKTLPTGTEVTVDYSDVRTWTDNATYSIGNPLHTAELSFTLRQPVLRNFFGYVDRNSVKLSKIEASLAGLEALNRIENTIAEIEMAYWGLVFSYQDVKLREELLRQAEELYGVFKKHLKTGLVEETELYETEANMRIRKADLLVSENNLITASNNLKFLLNEDGVFLFLPEEKLAIIGDEVNFVDSLKIALVANREYRIEKKDLEGKNVTVKMKRNSLWPEVDLVGTFALNGIDQDFSKANRRLTTTKSPEYYGGIEFKIPIENRQARAEYHQAVLTKKKVLLRLIKTEKDIITTIDDKVRNVNLQLENAKRWTKIKDIQDKKFRKEEQKLKFGRSRSKVVVDFQNDLTLAALSEYDAILQYYIALIELENEKDTLLNEIGVISYEDI